MLSKLKNNPLFLSATIGFNDLYTRFFSSKPSREDISQKMADVVSEIRLNGCVALEGIVPAEVCDELVAAHKYVGDYTDVTYKNDRRTWGIQNVSAVHVKYLKYLEDHLGVKSIGEKYCGSKIKLSSLLAGRLLADSAERGGSGAGWHRDSHTQQFKSILYLTDVTEKNGPFQYIKGSHLVSNIRKVLRMSSLKHEDSRLTRYTEDDIEAILSKLNLKVTTCVGRKGTILLADTRGIHRGAPIEQGERFALTTYYTASAVKVTEVQRSLNADTINSISNNKVQPFSGSGVLDKIVDVD